MANKIISALALLFIVIAAPFAVFAQDNISDDINTSIENVTVSDDDQETEIEDEVEAEVEDEEEAEVEEEEEIEVEVEEEEIEVEEEEEAEVEVEEEEIEVEEEIDEEEAEILSDLTGAQVRLLQLEKRVDIQIDNANEIITEVENNNGSLENITRLKEIVEEFVVIKIKIEEMDLNQSADILAEEFVSLKKEAIELSQEFKKIVRSCKCLKDADKVELKERIRLKREEKLKIKSEKIENLKRKFNAKKTSAFLSEFGVGNGTIIEQIESGELNATQIKLAVKNRLRNLTSEQKERTLIKIKEDRVKVRSEFAKKAEDINEKVRERKEIQKNKTKEIIEKREKEIKSRIEKREKK